MLRNKAPEAAADATEERVEAPGFRGLFSTGFLLPPCDVVFKLIWLFKLKLLTDRGKK